MKIHEIEKGIELPTSLTYPFSQMEIGDSFFIMPTGEEDLHHIRKNINSPMHYYNRKTGKKLIARTMKKENGVRIWRRE